MLYGKQECESKSLEFKDNIGEREALEDEAEDAATIDQLYADIHQVRERISSNPDSLAVEVGSRSVHPNSVPSMKLGSVVGEGAFGVVRRITNRTKQVAKVIKMDTTDLDGTGSTLQNVVQHHANLFTDIGDHPNIVRMDKVLLDHGKGTVVHVMEELDGALPEPGTRGSAVPGAESYRCFSATDCLFIAQDVLSALQFLHGKGIVHGDVKPPNILYQETYDGEFIYKRRTLTARSTMKTVSRATHMRNKA